MSKINLSATVINNDEKFSINTLGIKNNNKVVYKENDIMVTILIFDNKIEMNRECNEYKINLIFEKNKTTTSKYNVFGAPKTFNLETITNKLVIDNDFIIIEYVLEGNKIYYRLDLGGNL